MNVPIVSSLFCYCKSLAKLPISFFIPCRSSCPQGSSFKAVWVPEPSVTTQQSQDEVSSQQTRLPAVAGLTFSGKGLPEALWRPTRSHRQEAVRALSLRMATQQVLSFPSSPSERTQVQGSGRLSVGVRSRSKWDASSVYLDHGVSDNAWLGSPPDSSWISPAREAEMKLRWAHTSPNGMLVWVPPFVPF